MSFSAMPPFSSLSAWIADDASAEGDHHEQDMITHLAIVQTLTPGFLENKYFGYSLHYH